MFPVVKIKIMNKVLITLLAVLGLVSISCESIEKRNDSQYGVISSSENSNVRELLDRALSNNSNENISTNLTEIDDEETAIKAVEPILFEGYGTENILEQKPYKVSKIDNYWVIEGKQKEPLPGGVFHLVLESKSGIVIYLTHDK
ncbi:MAG: NTF2 fold immunity protein [Marinoscillum sp.]